MIALRIFAIPVILLIMRWNKKQQPDGPVEGYCLQRTRGRLIQLLWAAIVLLAVAALSVYLVTSWMEGGPERGYTCLLYTSAFIPPSCSGAMTS